jgi:hypothetical protein
VAEYLTEHARYITKGGHFHAVMQAELQAEDASNCCELWIGSGDVVAVEKRKWL